MANLIINLNKRSTTQINNNWTYNDIDVSFDDNKSNKDVLAVRGSIRNILNWRKGQRILNPTFGNDLFSFIYENITEAMISNIKKSVRTMLNTEPRIKVININVISDQSDNAVVIDVEYIITKIGITVKDTIIVN